MTIDDGRAYSLGSMGRLFCFDAATGGVLWSKDLYTAYKIRMPDWGIAASPLIDGDLVIVHIGGSDGACLMGFDKKTGKEHWKALDDRASYSSPIVITQAGKRVLICWTADRVVGLNPQTGQLLATGTCPGPRSFGWADIKNAQVFDCPSATWRMRLNTAANPPRFLRDRGGNPPGANIECVTGQPIPSGVNDN